jgi:hypothetical protein
MGRRMDNVTRRVMRGVSMKTDASEGGGCWGKLACGDA